MLLIAEIGLNHDGNFDLIYELIRRAKWAGADIVKFQFAWRGQADEMNFIDAQRARQLQTWCDYAGIEIMASLFTAEALALAKGINMQRYKIASRTVIDNPRLCEQIIAEGKETFISLGMWDKAHFPFGDPAANNNIRYLYCRSKYPTAPQDLQHLPQTFCPRTYAGYSDHLQGIEACVLAVARGAQVIEKHFTLNKTSQVIRDHVLSASPEEFRQLVEVARPLSALVAAL